MSAKDTVKHTATCIVCSEDLDTRAADTVELPRRAAGRAFRHAGCIPLAPGRREGTNIPIHAPWRAEPPSRYGTVRVLDKTNAEILVCQQHHAEAIVKAVNWCSSRGYIK